MRRRAALLAAGPRPSARSTRTGSRARGLSTCRRTGLANHSETAGFEGRGNDKIWLRGKWSLCGPDHSPHGALFGTHANPVHGRYPEYSDLQTSRCSHRPPPCRSCNTGVQPQDSRCYCEGTADREIGHQTAANVDSHCPGHKEHDDDTIGDTCPVPRAPTPYILTEMERE